MYSHRDIKQGDHYTDTTPPSREEDTVEQESNPLSPDERLHSLLSFSPPVPPPSSHIIVILPKHLSMLFYIKVQNDSRLDMFTFKDTNQKD